MTHAEGAAPASGMRDAVRRGVAWKLGSLAATQILRLVTIVLIARVLAPEEFGVAAIALSTWTVATVVTDLALGAALVQKAEIDESDRSTVFWASTGAGCVLALAGIACSGLVAKVFDEPDVKQLFAALALAVLFNSLASTPVALLTRAMDFRTLELVSLAAAVAGAAAGISLAYAGAGAWALVATALVGSAVSCALIWSRSGWRPGLQFSRARLRRHIGFAATFWGTRAVAGLQRNGDRLLVGRFLGAAELGAYAVPAGIVSVPASRLVDPIRSVLFPAFSRLQQSLAELADAWSRVTRLVCALLAPVLVALALAADDVVELVLGSSWSEATPVLRIIALAALVQLASSMSAVVLAALGRLSTVLHVFVATFLLSVGGFLIGQRYGLTGAAAGYAAATVVMTPLYVYLTARELELGLRPVVSTFLPRGGRSGRDDGHRLGLRRPVRRPLRGRPAAARGGVVASVCARRAAALTRVATRPEAGPDARSGGYKSRLTSRPAALTPTCSISSSCSVRLLVAFRTLCATGAASAATCRPHLGAARPGGHAASAARARRTGARGPRTRRKRQDTRMLRAAAAVPGRDLLHDPEHGFPLCPRQPAAGRRSPGYITGARSHQGSTNTAHTSATSRTREGRCSPAPLSPARKRLAHVIFGCRVD